MSIATSPQHPDQVQSIRRPESARTADEFRLLTMEELRRNEQAEARYEEKLARSWIARILRAIAVR